MKYIKLFEYYLDHNGEKSKIQDGDTVKVYHYQDKREGEDNCALGKVSWIESKDGISYAVVPNIGKINTNELEKINGIWIKK